MRASPRSPGAVLAAALVCFSVPLGAEVRRVDEAAAVELALRGDAAAAAQRLDLEAKERKAATAGNAFLPSLTASATGRESLSGPADSFGGLPWTPSVSARVSTAVTLSATALQAGKTAALEAAASRVQSRAAVEKVERETRKAFYRLLLLREQRKVAEAAVDIAAGSRDRTAEEYRSGLASARTRRQAEIAYESERLALARRNAEYETARSAFSARLGLGTDDWEPVGELAFPAGGLSAVSAGRADLAARADTALAAAQIAVQESRLAEERRTLTVPSLGVSAYLETASAGEIATVAGSLSVTLSSPNLSAFLPFSKERVSLDAGAGTLEKLRLQAAETSRAAALEVESLLRTLSVSASAAASLAASVELAVEVVGLTREAYDVGAASYQDLRTAEKDADAARAALLAERYTYLAAAIDLEYALGTNVRRAKEPS